MPRTLRLRAPRDLALTTQPDRPLGSGEVRLRSLVSGISHGTELNLYRGTAPFRERRFDPRLRAFLPREDDDSAYPCPLGYEMVSRVDEVGPEVQGVAVGDLVHSGSPHQEETILHLREARSRPYPPVVLPAGMDPDRGLFVSLGMVALQAVHDAGVKLGDGVAVFGLGTIGLLTAQLVRLDGARRVIAVDPIARRRELAAELGVDEAVDAAGAGAAVKRRTDGGVDTAVETSGSYEGLHQAIASVCLGGRVVSVGYYQGGGAALRLGEEWHHNRPQLLSSMGAWDCPHRDAPLWDRARMAATVVDLLAGGELVTGPLITQRVAFADAAEAYRLIDRRPEDTVKVALTYDGSG